jgi:hypothetical protein
VLKGVVVAVRLGVRGDECIEGWVGGRGGNAELLQQSHPLPL